MVMEMFPEASFSLLFNTLLFAAALAFVLSRFSGGKKKKPRGVDVEEHAELLEKRLKKFKPEALAQPLTDFDKINLSSMHVVESRPDVKVSVDGQKNLLNFASTDFLGMATDDSVVVDKAKECLLHYGCGSCGPRGFYGTFDVHLILEEKLSKLFGSEGAIVYSDSFSVVPSVVGAFVNRQDTIVCDEAVCETFLNGIHLSRGNVVFYKHVDAADCERKLQEAQKNLKTKGRLFLLSEAVFKNTGRVCPLKKLVELRSKYTARLLLDESLSFGVLGATGRGLCEEEKIPVSQIDFLTASMDNVCATIGGFCIATKNITEYQRLMGAGYCFSAAVSPVLSATAVLVLEKIENAAGTKEDLPKKLRANIEYFHSKVKANKKLSDAFYTPSSVKSPLCVFELTDKTSEGSRVADYTKVRNICEKLMSEGVFIVAAAFTPSEAKQEELKPFFKVCFSAKHSKADIDTLINKLEVVANDF